MISWFQTLPFALFLFSVFSSSVKQESENVNKNSCYFLPFYRIQCWLYVWCVCFINTAYEGEMLWKEGWQKRTEEYLKKFKLKKRQKKVHKFNHRINSCFHNNFCFKIYPKNVLKIQSTELKNIPNTSGCIHFSWTLFHV